MFKNLLPFLFTAIFLSISCSNDDLTQNNYEESLSMAKISNVLDLKGNAQKLAFSSLNATEKHFIWNNRLEEIKNSIRNDNQTRIIEELKSQLSIEYFQNPTVRNSKMEYFEKMKLEAYIVFGKELSKGYFSTLEDIASLNSRLKDASIDDIDIGGGDRICNCNTQDDWCVWGSSCFAGFCRQLNSGCGWWLEQPCNGVCVSN